MFRPAPNVKASSHAEGMVFIHHGTGTVFSANRVGAMIWKGATEGRSLEEVTASISTEFDIPSQIVRQDAVAFLAQLQAEGLLIPNAK
jgi:coenzyme PQQ synthesis protein D (PqqD)